MKEAIIAAALEKAAMLDKLAEASVDPEKITYAAQVLRAFAGSIEADAL